MDNLVDLLKIQEGKLDTIIVGYERFEDVSNKIIKNNENIYFLNDVNFNMTPRSLPILQPFVGRIYIIDYFIKKI